MSEETKVKKYLLVGSTLPEDRISEIMKVLKGFTEDVEVITLENLEMNNIVSKRLEIAKEDDVVKFLEDEIQRESALSLAMKFLEYVKGSPDDYHTKKYFKSFTNLSWSQFKKSIETLKLFGYVEELKSNPDFIRFLVDEGSIEKAALRRIVRLTDELDSEIKLAYPAIKDKEAKEELYKFKRKLSLRLKNGFR